MKRYFLFTFIAILLFVVSCESDEEQQMELVSEEVQIDTNVEYSFVDSSTYKVEGAEITQSNYWIKNPTTGNWLEASVYQPTDMSQEYPGVVLVPGGDAGMENFLHPYDGPRGDKEVDIAEKFASEGFSVLIFSADGRGNSEGTKNSNGYKDQDALYEMYNFLVDYNNVDTEKMGVVSYSFGIVMATGMLGRYQLDLLYYIEWEGPFNKYGTDEGEYPASQGVERELSQFFPYFEVDHFLMVQTEKDHVQDTNQHTVDINNMAIKYLDWVRVNGPENEVNAEYTVDTIPVLSEEENYQDTVLAAMKEFTA